MRTSSDTDNTQTWKTILLAYQEDFPFELRDLREMREKYLANYSVNKGVLGINLGMTERAVRLLIACGPDVVREELRTLAPLAREQAEQMFQKYFRADGQVTASALVAATGVCLYECLGLGTGGALAVFKPHLVRIETSRRDQFVFQHWNRALIALALDVRATWGPIAGFMPNDSVPFTPEATFAFNVQGFVAHLAGALIHGRAIADVLPAWRDFVRCFPELQAVAMADTGTLLWAARLVHHHIGGHALDTTGAFLYDEVRMAVPESA